MDENKEKDFIVQKAAESSSYSTVKHDYSKEVRKNIDDIKKRNSIRDDICFGDKRTTVDPYTGAMLHREKSSATAKYGQAKTTKHIGQMDHTVPLERIYKVAQINPYLDYEAIKRIANTTGNYKFINTNLNASKQSSTNLEYVFNHWKDIPKEQARKMIEEDFNARVCVSAVYLKETINGISREATQGGLTAAKYEAVISGFTHLNNLLNGEEDASSATINVAKDTGKAFVHGGGAAVVNKGIEQSVLQIANKANNEVVEHALSSFCKAGYIPTVVVGAKEVGSSLIKYINNELDFDELVLELGEKGSGFVSSILVGGEGLFLGAIVGSFIGTMIMPGAGTQIGGKIGAVAGEFIGNMIGYTVGTKLYDYISFLATTNDLPHLHFEELHKEQEALRHILDEYQKDLEKQLEIIQLKGDILEDCFTVLESKTNSELFYSALDTISIMYGGTQPAMTRDEFFDVMMDDNKKFKL